MQSCIISYSDETCVHCAIEARWRHVCPLRYRSTMTTRVSTALSKHDDETFVYCAIEARWRNVRLLCYQARWRNVRLLRYPSTMTTHTRASWALSMTMRDPHSKTLVIVALYCIYIFKLGSCTAVTGEMPIVIRMQSETVPLTSQLQHRHTNCCHDYTTELFSEIVWPLVDLRLYINERK